MREGPDIAKLAAFLADPARSNMLTALLAVPALTAKELAEEAGISAPTASGHLQMMLGAGLLEMTAQGRHRYYRLSGEPVAHLLEQMLGHAERLGFLRTRVGLRDPELRHARTCYDHMAGEVAVRLYDRMLDAGLMEFRDRQLKLTGAGHDMLLDFGIPAAALASGPRPACRACLDWSERREHLAGRVGAALLERFLQLQWVYRSGRTLTITSSGRRGLEALFSVASTARTGEATALFESGAPSASLQSRSRARRRA